MIVWWAIYRLVFHSAHNSSGMLFELWRRKHAIQYRACRIRPTEHKKNKENERWWMMVLHIYFFLYFLLLASQRREANLVRKDERFSTLLACWISYETRAVIQVERCLSAINQPPPHFQPFRTVYFPLHLRVSARVSRNKLEISSFRPCTKVISLYLSIPFKK